MFIVGKSFFSKILSTFNIKTIAPLCLIHIPLKMLAVVNLPELYNNMAKSNLVLKAIKLFDNCYLDR